MNDPLFTLSQDQWQSSFTEIEKQHALSALENGQLVYFPQLAFKLQENETGFLTTRYSTEKRKNISYNRLNDRLGGVQELSAVDHEKLKLMLQRYAIHARSLVDNLFPQYRDALLWGRTSYRPVPISAWVSSFRKDDKRLHVDAFPSSPNQGKRILRVFCNVNPQGEDRVWRVGEPFESVAKQFSSRLAWPLPGSGHLLKYLHITRGLRTRYDHLMLQLHNKMKEDTDYQQNAKYTEIHLPPGSSWIVQTDQVSHAALRGQFMFEQTFYLPVAAMQNPELSPLRVLESLYGRALT